MYTSRLMADTSAALAALTLAFVIGCASEVIERQHFEPPVAAGDALATMEVAAGFKIELFAAEPLIADPVAMEVDEWGRLYVVEMPGYPLDVEGSGRVKLLEDTNDDGFPDRATIFADGLVLPKGIMRWKNGIIVTDAPDLVYLEDSTGDGKADVREVMLTGFARTNPQHNFNKPIYGLDNWIYLANSGTIRTETYHELFGDTGSEIRFPGNPDAPVLPRNADNRNVRFRPDTYEMELLSSRSQFGHDFDTWGRHFLMHNSNHNYHEVVAARYLDRNPDFPIPSATHNTSDHGNAAEVFPITENPEHQLLTDIGVMTSASGLTAYTGGAFPPGYDNVMFIAESVYNMVHADHVVEDGATFEARRVVENKEFLASTDSWSRPVNFYVGPDGALYVLDYYRRIVEHPQWMDEEVVRTQDLYAGKDFGRIYRISATNAPRPAWLSNLNLGSAVTEELIETLENPNLWWRRHAQRLLLDREGEDARLPLVQLVTESSNPKARLHALWTLEGLGQLPVNLIQEALRDPEAGLRENAIQLAELHILEHPELMNDLLRMQGDPSPRVRYQLALTLGSHDTAEVNAARNHLLHRDIEDEWMQIAVLSATSRRDPQMFDRAVAELSDLDTPARRAYFRRVGALISAGSNQNELRPVIVAATDQTSTDDVWWRAAVLEGMANHVRQAGIDVSTFAAERDRFAHLFFETESPEMRRACLVMLEALGIPPGAVRSQLVARAVDTASDSNLDPSFRADALRLLALTDPGEHLDLMKSLVHPQEPAEVQRAALRNLAMIEGEEVGLFVLEQWDRITPQVREEAVNVLLADQDRVRRLLDAVEQNRVLVSSISWGRRVGLMQYQNDEIRARARTLLSEDPAARREVVQEYQTVTDLRGNLARGRQVYVDSCAPCHQMGEELGTAFGPDLGTVRHWSTQALIAKILDPNRAIADGYELWIVERNDGGTVAGVISSETPSLITFRDVSGEETTIMRSDIASIRASNVSVMPSGMEAQISPQQMADLIAFLRER